jgi:hypothetical protein
MNSEQGGIMSDKEFVMHDQFKHNLIQPKVVKMGLGEAMLRLNKLQVLISSGVSVKDHKEEYSMIMEALNNIQIDIGFDCNNDGVPDTVDIFQASANTSCCRLMDTESSRKKKTSSRKKKKTSSRKK